MNRLSFLFLLLYTISFSSQAQVILEKTYSSGPNYAGFEFNLVNEDFFTSRFYSDVSGLYTFNRDNYRYSFYRTDHSLVKTTIIAPPEGYIFSYHSFFSTKTFNSDEKVEFIAVYQKENSVTGSEFSARIMDEDGVTLQELGSYSGITWYIDTDGRKNLICTKAIRVYPDSQSDFSLDVQTSIFRVIGDSTTATGKVVDKVVASAYPNPASSHVTLPYRLPKGTTSLLRICRLDGSEVERKTIDSNFDNLELSVGNYRPGIYVYEYNGNSNKFIVR